MTIISRIAISHAPGIVAWRDRAEPEVAERFFAGCAEASRRLHAAAPDVLVLVTAEHFSNFLDVVPPYYVNIGSDCSGPAESYLGLPVRAVPGCPDLARGLVSGCMERGAEVAFGHDLRLDHGAIVPLEILSVPSDLPVIPLIVNCSINPMPTYQSCRRLGEAMGDVLKEASERVAVVAAGGLSHWPGMAEAGKMSPKWDRAVLLGLSEGRWSVLSDDIPHEGEEDKGPGAEELRAWTVAGATVSDKSRGADILSYEPVEAWSTGCAVLDMGVGETDGLS